MGDSAVRGLDSLPASSKMWALPCSVTAGVEVMEMAQVESVSYTNMKLLFTPTVAGHASIIPGQVAS